MAPSIMKHLGDEMDLVMSLRLNKKTSSLGGAAASR